MSSKPISLTYAVPNCDSLRFVNLTQTSLHNHEAIVISFLVLNIVFAVASCVSNLIIILSMVKTSTLLRMPSNVLLFGLSLSDFGVAVISQPFFCMQMIGELRQDLTMFCTFGIAYDFSGWTLISASFLIVSWIAADRFLAVHLHLRYNEVVTVKRCTVLLIVVLLFSVILAIFRLSILHDAVHYFVTAYYLLVMMITFYFFYKVWQEIRRHSRQIQAQHQSTQPNINMPRYKKTVNTMYYVIGAFVICYVPALVISICYDWIREFSPRSKFYIILVSESILLVNSVINPLLYCWKSREIRSAAQRLLKW